MKRLGRPKGKYAQAINSIFNEGSSRTKARRVVEMTAFSSLSSLYLKRKLIVNADEFNKILSFEKYHQLFYFFGQFIVFAYNEEDILYLSQKTVELTKVLPQKDILRWLKQQTHHEDNKELVKNRYKRQITALIEQLIIEDILFEEEDIFDFIKNCALEAKKIQWEKALDYVKKYGTQE